jgi:hypothetical protein
LYFVEFLIARVSQEYPMFELRLALRAIRGLTVAAWLVLLAGCGPGDLAPLASVPAGLTATAGVEQVTLNWTASSDATGYEVQRGTAKGGPYTMLASTTSPTYTDSAVTDTTTYYYVVSAKNPSGTSANSAEVSATPTTRPPAFGTWVNVTPANVNLTSGLCGNAGTQTVQADTMHPTDLYTEFNCQGIWKSTDYGATWTGPINTGTNGAAVSDCGSGITVSPSRTGGAPTLYEACIRGTGLGFWKSVDGGVNWTHYLVGASTDRQDYFPPVIDPHDSNHLLLAAHEFNSIAESVDGGQTWTQVPLNNGMLQNQGTGLIFFIDTGTATSTRGNWLWMGQSTGGAFGTWRTTNSGTSWNRVDKNEHFGAGQIYQPDTTGVVFMAGTSSDLGAGVLRSTDYGQTWTHVGLTVTETIVVGTSKNLYSMAGAPVAAGSSVDPAFEVAAQPGTGTWFRVTTAAALTQGTAQFAVVNNGTNNILLGAMYNGGLWRYVEP